ncbi:MAG: class I SAM-dependent methyltransferase [Labilithrix sp.]|nr:class I SAM-dependent methyltransferase [Labilithrix sp.]MCW5809370.1 class I SAM-dependent methyltransferase [Labilithrix sp.]
MSKTIAEYVTFSDRNLADRWSGKKVPMSDVYEAYIDGRLDIENEKWDAFFESRHDTMSFRLTDSHVKWAVTNFIPEVLIHSRSQDKRIVGEHYNRGNDFFGWFLGESMVYTAGWWGDENVLSPENLEQAQYKKIDRCCEKLHLKKGETLLDIGCGWGTFVARAAKQTGANTLGVCLAEEQVAFGTQRIADYGVKDNAKVEVCDYREVKGQFDKIVSLEMVEHVGIKNLDQYFEKVHALLKDDGIFVLQWTGIRNLYNPQNPLSAVTLKPEDLIWGLFMNRYIFPGADASLPLSSMLRAAENAGFETADVENMSTHYVKTLRAWCDLWVANRTEVIKAYGERWYRLWKFFLHWSALIGEQGTGFTYQVTFTKNGNNIDRLKLRTPR